MLAKENRVSRKKEIDGFFGVGFKKAHGFSYSTKNIIIKALPGATDLPRAGFVVSTKVDKRATVRNKVKRQLRSIIQELLPRIQKVDLLVLVNAGAKKLDFEQLKGEVVEILSKMRVINK